MFLYTDTVSLCLNPDPVSEQYPEAGWVDPDSQDCARHEDPIGAEAG